MSETGVACLQIDRNFVSQTTRSRGSCIRSTATKSTQNKSVKSTSERECESEIYLNFEFMRRRVHLRRAYRELRVDVIVSRQSSPTPIYVFTFDFTIKVRKGAAGVQLKL